MDRRIETLNTALLGLAVGIAFIGAFVGLGVSSFWFDELYTLWVIGDGHSLSATFGRAITDVHPPLYYLSLLGFVQVAGISEAGVRLFSALCATGAIAWFILGTRFAIRLPARLFAAAMGMASLFWYMQSQNARSYSLVLLIGTGLLVASLRIVDAGGRGTPITRWLLLFGLLSGLGIFVHFYMLIVSLAALATLFLLVPGARPFACLWAAALTAAMLGYIRFVLTPNSLVLLDKSWIGNSAGWYAGTAWDGMLQLFSRTVLPAVAAVIVGALVVLARRHPSTKPGQAKLLLLCAGTVMLTLAGGIASSLLLHPNFTDRNFATVSPFVWGLLAICYDIGVPGVARGRVAAALMLGIALVTLYSSFRIRFRLDPHNTPYRESAAWIAAQPGCRGAGIPVLYTGMTPMRPGEIEYLASQIYGYYLPKSLPTVPFGLPGAAELVETPPACPVVAWAAYFVGDAKGAAKVADQLAVRRGAPVAIRSFGLPRSDHAAFVFVKVPQPTIR